LRRSWWEKAAAEFNRSTAGKTNRSGKTDVHAMSFRWEAGGPGGKENHLWKKVKKKKKKRGLACGTNPPTGL